MKSRKVHSNNDGEPPGKYTWVTFWGFGKSRKDLKTTVVYWGEVKGGTNGAGLRRGACAIVPWGLGRRVKVPLSLKAPL